MHVATKVCERVHRGFGSSVGYEHCYTVDRENGEEIALLGIGWLSASLSYQGVGKTPTPAFVINDSGGQHMVLGRQSMNVMTIAAEHVSRSRVIIRRPGLSNDRLGTHRPNTLNTCFEPFDGRCTARVCHSITRRKSFEPEISF